MSRHYHGQSHARIGIASTDDFPPNARYWKNSAFAAFDRLAVVIGEDEALRQTENVGDTWKQRYDATTILADLAEKQAASIRNDIRNSEEGCGNDDLYDWARGG